MSPVAHKRPEASPPATELVALGDLVPYPGNARVHNLDAIKESLQVNGQYRPIVAQRTTRHVLVGNGTLEAATALGWERISVVWLDVNDEAALRIVIADNRTSDLATYDEQALVGLLKPLEADLSGTAFSVDDLEDLLAAAGQLPESDAEPFEGGYSESQADAERRRNTGTPLMAQGFKEVILLLRTDQVDPFKAAVTALQQAWGTESTTETVVRALEQCQTAER